FFFRHFQISQFDIAASELYPYPSVSQKLRDISKDAIHPGSETHHHTHCAATANFTYVYGDLENASLKYREALNRIETLLLREKPGDHEWIDLDKQNIPLFLNLSLCCLNKKQYYEAIDAASEVLKRDELNEKALYRRAKARIAVWDLEKV
ncbi:unnamed protein product, partial [Gongylonema pulchrum]|uniref:TPR_REGION domain-containing protein n=1 Tax=Gongylonema pulchrum TaxID=637853 RepID=A0A183D8S0_9BILA